MSRDLDDRLEAALGEPYPTVAVRALAQALRDEGMAQADLSRLYSERFQRAEADDIRYGALQEALDVIVDGPWAKGRDLYPGADCAPPFSRFGR